MSQVQETGKAPTNERPSQDNDTTPKRSAKEELAFDALISYELYKTILSVVLDAVVNSEYSVHHLMALFAVGYIACICQDADRYRRRLNRRVRRYSSYRQTRQKEA